MCGIAGIFFSRNDEKELLDRIQRMNEAQKHRGPDADDVVIEPGTGIGHVRLALLDVEGGGQPMTDVTGRYVLTYNGQIYNYLELRKELNGLYPFHTQSDSEVLLAAYSVWGESCLDRLDGMFAFCIWDRKTKTCFAARDALGVKPLVYTEKNGEIIIASETKAILSVWEKTMSIDEWALIETVVVPSLSGVRHSMIEGINHLPAGHKLIATENRVEVTSWFSYKIGDGELENDIIESLREALVSSVRKSLRADFPIGLFLSGGLDSSLLTSVTVSHAGNELDAFTICFDNHEDIDFNPASIVISDDVPYAKRLAKTLGFRLHLVSAGQDDICGAMRELSRINDRVPIWEQEFTQYFLSKEAVRFCKAILVGDAADETHFGYFFALNETVNYGPKGFMDAFGADRRVTCLAPRLRKHYDPIDRLDEEYRQIVKRGGYQFGDSRENLQAMSYLIVQLWLGRLLHNGDIHCMAHGLEGRVPFANREIIAQSQRVPAEWGYRSGIEKFTLRKAAEPLLIQEIVNRKKSALPRDPRLSKHYQKILKQLVETEKDFIREYLDIDELGRLVNQAELKENERILVFNLISLINWGRCYYVR